MLIDHSYNSLPLRRFLIFAALLTLCFALPLVNWARFALHSGLFSYVLLVPFISAYLGWIRRNYLAGEAEGARWPAAILAAAGFGLAAASKVGSSAEALTYQLISYCFLLWSGGFVLLGLRKMRSMAFPALFLLFMVPIPESLVSIMETALQNASAELGYGFIKLSGIAVYRSGLNFQMPGIALSVARECSGIRSTLVLFLCSLLAGHLSLRSTWTRWVLALFVIPLGIVRNAFRILTIAMLCVRVDSTYINSPIHHNGGPIFFALSLIPFGIVLLWMRRLEKSSQKTSH